MILQAYIKEMFLLLFLFPWNKKKSSWAVPKYDSCRIMKILDTETLWKTKYTAQSIACAII